MSQAAIDLCDELALAWRPPERLPLSEWSEKNYFLETGSIRLTKFQKGILDAINDPALREISICKSARLGLTMSLDIYSLFAVASGEQIGYVFPRQEDTRQHSSLIWQQALERCPAVADLKSVGKRDTMQEKAFSNGATIKFLVANANSARRHNLTCLLLDEIDAYTNDEEGDVIRLMKQRVKAATRSKVVLTSTPTGKNSNIYREYIKGDQRQFFMPCPHCAEDITFEPSGLHVDGKPLLDFDADAVKALASKWECEYACQVCGGIIDEQQRAVMVESGDWRATAEPAEPGLASFKINALISPFPSARMNRIAADYLDAVSGGSGGGSASLDIRGVVNTVFGEIYSESLDDLHPKDLEERAQPVPELLPDDTLFVTCGIDLGPRYADLLFVGHGPKSHRILHMVRVEGDVTAGNELFEKIDRELTREWTSELGGTLRCSVVGIDTGFATAHAYKACEARVGMYPLWVPLKGVAGETAPIIALSKQKPSRILRETKLRLVGTFQAKTYLLARLGQDDPTQPGYFHLAQPPAVPKRFFEEVIAEERIETVNQKGVLKVEWRPKSSTIRSESMDCASYALAVLIDAPPNYDYIREELDTRNADKPQTGGLSAIGDRLNGDAWRQLAQNVPR